MRLSILIYSLASGGAERVVSILLKALSFKYNITLVLMNDTIFYDIPKNVKVVYLEYSNSHENGILKLLKLPWLGFKYKRLIKDNDISLSFMNRPNYINILAKLFGSNVKTIISERAMPSLQHKIGVQGFINRFMIKQLYNISDTVTANSMGNSLDLKKNFYINDVITINNPFDIKNIIKLSKEQVNLNSNSFKFITIGRLDNGKNYKLLISSIKDINANLYIIGDGELRVELEKQIFDLGLQNKVFLLGRQINPYKYLVKADCFVFGSNYEGFPNVLLEALACGLPVISTDCLSGPREILSPSSDIDKQLEKDIEKVEYGVLTTVNDEESMTKAMNLMMEDKKLRDSYKDKALTRAKDFDKDKIIKEWIKLIEENI